MLASPAGRTIGVQTAPAVRITLCNGLGLSAGTVGTGKMVTLLKQLGFNYVFDTNFGTDLTIVEEATELVSRLTKGTGFQISGFPSRCQCRPMFAIEQCQQVRLTLD
jgi:NADH-quinone oxidoreductase subunit G